MASSRKSRSTDPRSAVAASLAALPLSGERLCVGLSGGVDSVVLLDLLDELRPSLGFHLSAIHVHHGLSPHADDWARHCEALCAARQVPLTVRRVTVERVAPEGLEAAARAARFAAFASVGADWMVLGHHRDDQAETLLFRLVRGGGLRGAAGMAAVERRPAAPGLLRPLLAVGRPAIEAHARVRGLDWVEDESNASLAHARNFMRHAVLPLLAGRFPAAAVSLARASAHFRESLDLLDALAAEDWARGADAAVYPLALARALDDARLRNLLRWRIHALALDLPEEPRLREAVRQLRGVPTAHPLHLPLGAAELCHYRGLVWVQPALGAADAAREWRGEPVLPWAGGVVRFERAPGVGIACPGGASRVELGRRAEGERMQIVVDGPSRSIKNLMQEAGVPPWLRERLPMLRVDGRLAWIAGVGTAAWARCTPNDAGLQPLWQAPPGVISCLPEPPADR